MLRIRYPDAESCVAALSTASRLSDSVQRELLIEDLFIAFEVAGFDRRQITALGLKFCETQEPTLPEQETAMPRTKGSPEKAPRKRRDVANSPFHTALKSAEALLTQRRKALIEAQATVLRLQMEIPNLESTINALNRQLNPSAPPAGLLQVPVLVTTGKVNGAPIDEAVVGHEVQEGMGVVLATPEGVPPQEQAPDLDAIPGMGGTWS
jgi:hypothetical protein